MNQAEKAKTKPDIFILVKTGHFYFGVTETPECVDIPCKPVDNREMEKRPIHEVLEEIGALLEIKGENSFKVNAYHNAARTIKGTENLDEIIEEGRLKEIKGIGAALAQKIEEYHRTGKMDYYEELTREIPAGLLEMTGVPGVGPKKIKILFDVLEINNIGELEYACRENRLIALSGFGAKTQEKILKGIEFFKKHKGQYLIGDVFPVAQSVKQHMQDKASPSRIEICGSIRRRKETVHDIDILAAGDDHERITDAFVSAPEVEEVVLRGETKTSCRLASGIEADLRVISEEAFPYALVYFTGSKEHNVMIRGIAKRRGWKLNEYGLFEGDRLLSCEGETELYGRLGLSYIPPELREAMGEVEAAERGSIPELVRPEDIKGTFHVHTDFSDGATGLESMVEAARNIGFSYIGIADHSKSAYYAHGLKREDVLRQWDLIERLNGTYDDIYIFKGIESDILPDGSLDYDDDILEGFDFVIASIHSNFTMKKKDMEKRIVGAIENPHTTMLGHPTGRLLLSRDGYEVDMGTIIDRAAENGVVMELNASRYRLDLDWRHMKYAKEKGVLISINPDAHSTAGFAEMQYGIGIARKGWQERKDVLNTRDVNDIKDTFVKIRDGKKYNRNHQ